MSSRWKDVAASAAEVVLSLIVVYSMTPDATMETWRWTSRFCQGVARVFGSWGLRAERKYMDLAEQNRMI